MLRFLAHWRYLIAACFIFASFVAYLLSPQINFDVAGRRVPGKEPALFQQNYQRIESEMTEDQVTEILGPPDNRAEIDASAWLYWGDKYNNGCAVWIIGDIVAAKKYWRAGESLDGAWEDLPR
jgi:hypothetical protein